MLETLEAGKPARSVECNEDEALLLSDVALLTTKPVIYAANMSEEDFQTVLILTRVTRQFRKLPPRKRQAFSLFALKLRQKS